MDFALVFQEYNQYIYAYAYKLTNNREQAEDLTQDTFFKAYEKIDQLRDFNYIKLWLRSICLNAHLMKIRKSNKYKDISCDDMSTLHNEGEKLNIDNVVPSIEDEIIVKEEIKTIQNGCFLTMVHRLSENQRIVFSLIDMFGLTTKEVSGILNLTESAIKALLYRARIKLDKFFGENCNLININNYCKCEAWDEFVTHREKMKRDFLASRNKIDEGFNAVNSHQNIEVEKKLRYLYANMPDSKPDHEWYDKVLSIIKKV